MANREHKPTNSGWEHDELDRTMDAALARYSAVEPRTGLEQRVLATLHAERARVPERSWWRWSIATAVAIVVIVAAVVALRPGKPAREVVKHLPSSPAQPARQEQKFSSTDTTKDVRLTNSRPLRKPTARRDHSALLAASHPKLDQFPSPQPLSEQEKILADYTAHFQDQAVLIARARSEWLRQDREKEMREDSADASGTDDSQANDATSR